MCNDCGPSRADDEHERNYAMTDNQAMTKRCQCGHGKDAHTGILGQCLDPATPTSFTLCPCEKFTPTRDPVPLDPKPTQGMTDELFGGIEKYLLCESMRPGGRGIQFVYLLETKNEIRRLRTVNAEQAAKISTFKANEDASIKIIADLRVELSDRDIKIAELEKEMVRITSVKDNEVAGVVIQRDDLRCQLAEKSATIAGLEKQLEDYEPTSLQDLLSANATIQELRKQLSEANAKLAGRRDDAPPSSSGPVVCKKCGKMPISAYTQSKMLGCETCDAHIEGGVTLHTQYSLAEWQRLNAPDAKEQR